MQQKKSIFYGWWIVIACSLTQFYLAVTYLNGFTAFFNPLVNEFKWSYTTVSLASTLRGFEAGGFAPVLGFLVDRFRPRRILFIGSLVTAIGFLIFSKIQNLWSFYVAFIILGFGSSMSSHVVVMTAVATWFKNRRTALAMGFLATGTAAAGLLIPGVIWLIDTRGWRHTLEYFAIGALVINLPLSFLVKDPPPEPFEIQPIKASGNQKPVMASLKTRDIIRQKNFWFLSLALFFVGLTTSAVSAHQIPYLTSLSLTREKAGWLVVIFSLANMGGRLGWGFLADIIDKRVCFMLTALTMSAGLVAFAYSTSVTQFLPSLILLGIGQSGIIPLRPVLQLQFFGLTSFATVQGITLVLTTVGTMISPPFAGWVFDTFHKYRPAWLILAALALVAVPVIMSTSRKDSKKALAEGPAP